MGEEEGDAAGRRGNIEGQPEKKWSGDYVGAEVNKDVGKGNEG